MRFQLALVLAWTAVQTIAWAGPAQEVERTLPDVYSKKIAALLTPVESVVAGKEAFIDQTSGITLLHETVIFRDDDGTTYRVIHFANYALGEAGVKGVSTDTFSFDHDRESIFLVSARSIQADGRILPAEPKATFIQSPQRSADDDEYDSQSELNIIYPKIAPGVVAEATVLIREDKPVIPGELAFAFSFGGGWPVYSRRFVVELSNQDWSRMHFYKSSVGLADPEVKAIGSFRERRIWSRRQIPETEWEENTPDLAFFVPTVWLSTLKSWDDVANWYTHLLGDRSDLGPELKKQVDAWTDHLKERESVIGILQEKVASEVRYTGLEFGIAGYQPNDCRSVWANRYGDCKDKANLLRAMLIYKGIPAYIALLDEGGDGQVQINSPSWKQFNHAIVAIPDGQNGFQFCDPTVKYLPALSLPASDMGRSVFVVADNQGRWAKTPDLLNGEIKVSIDASLSTAGELSGWLTLKATGTSAPYYAEKYRALDAHARRRDAQELGEAFLPGINAVDTALTFSGNSVREVEFKTYFTRQARPIDSDWLRCPFPASWLPEVSTSGTRQTPYVTARRRETLELKLKLPEGWTAAHLPESFSGRSSGGEFIASWKNQGSTIESDLTWAPTKLELSPEEYAAYRQSVRALKTWLEEPVSFAQKASIASIEKVDPTHIDLVDFPILPNGDGQLRLVDEKFPEGEKDQERREALRKVLQWFPADVETRFTARIELLGLDETKLGEHVYAEEVHKLLKKESKMLPATTRAWGEYLEALARWNDDKNPNATRILQSIAANKALDAYRRTWAAYEATLELDSTSPEKALAYATSYLDLEGEGQPRLVALAINIKAKVGPVSAFAPWLHQLVQQVGQEPDVVFAKALSNLSEGWHDLPTATQANCSAVISAVFSDAQAFPKASIEAKNLAEDVDRRLARAKLADEVRRYFATQSPAWYHPTTNNTDDVSAIASEIEAANKAADADRTLNAITQLWFSTGKVSFHSFALYTRWAVQWMEGRPGDDVLKTLVANQALHFPAAADSEVLEIWYCFAEQLRDEGKLDEATAWLQRMIDCPAAKDFQRVEAYGNIGLIRLKQNRVDDALAEFDLAEPLHIKLKKGVDFIYVAMLIQLQRGHYQRALELIRSIQKQDTNLIHQANYAVPIEQLLRAAQNPDHLVEYWKRSEDWWPKWMKILQDANVDASTASEVPLETDFDKLDARIKGALDRRNFLDAVREANIQVSLARWIPVFASDFSMHFSEFVELAGGGQKDFADFFYSLVHDLPPVDPIFDPAGKLWEVVSLLNLNRFEDAVAKAKLLYESQHGTGRFAEGAARLWALSSKQEAEKKEALDKLFLFVSEKVAVVQRIEDADFYAALLKADPQMKGRYLEYLEYESKRSDYNVKSARGAEIQSELKYLRHDISEGNAVTEVLKSWASSQQLDYLDRIEPASLNDPRFVGYQRPLTAKDDAVSRPQRLRFNWLFALDTRFPLDERLTAFAWVARDVSIEEPTCEGMAKKLVSIAQLNSLDSPLLERFLFLGLFDLYMNGAVKSAENLEASIQTRALRSDTREAIQRYGKACKLIASRPDGWANDAFDLLTKVPIDAASSEAIDGLIDRLVLSGHETEAKQILDRLASVSIAKSSNLTAASEQLQWTRTLRKAKQMEPFMRALRAQLQAFDSQRTEHRRPAVTPSVWFRTSAMTDAQWCDWFCEEGISGVVPTSQISSFVSTMTDSISLQNTAPKMGVELMKALLTNIGDDEISSSLVSSLHLLSDGDELDIRTEFKASFESFLKSPSAETHPLTRNQVLYILARYACRSSQDPDTERLVERYTNAVGQSSRAVSLSLRFLLSRGRNEEALATAEKLTPEELGTSRLCGTILSLLVQNGRSDEATLIKRELAAEIRKNVELGWEVPTSPRIPSTIELAIETDQAELIPTPWFDRVLRTSANEERRLSLQVLYARLHKNPQEIIIAADQFIALRPRYYDVYWHKSQAERQLGDRDAELKALSTFLKYCFDAPYYPAAKARFEQMTSASTTVASP